MYTIQYTPKYVYSYTAVFASRRRNLAGVYLSLYPVRRTLSLSIISLSSPPPRRRRRTHAREPWPVCMDDVTVFCCRPVDGDAVGAEPGMSSCHLATDRQMLNLIRPADARPDPAICAGRRSLGWRTSRWLRVHGDGWLPVHPRRSLLDLTACSGRSPVEEFQRRSFSGGVSTEEFQRRSCVPQFHGCDLPPPPPRTPGLKTPALALPFAVYALFRSPVPSTQVAAWVIIITPLQI